MSIIIKLVLAVVVAIFVSIVLYILGDVLLSLKADLATSIGNDLKMYGYTLGVIAGIWYFLAGSNFSWPLFGRKTE